MEINNAADKYAAYLKGFALVDVGRKRRSTRFDEQYGASISINTRARDSSKVANRRVSIWAGFRDIFKNFPCVQVLYNPQANAFALMPHSTGLKVCKTAQTYGCGINSRELVDQICEKFHLTGNYNRLRTKRIGELLFLYPPRYAGLTVRCPT